MQDAYISSVYTAIPQGIDSTVCVCGVCVCVCGGEVAMGIYGWKISPFSCCKTTKYSQHISPDDFCRIFAVFLVK